MAIICIMNYAIVAAGGNGTRMGSSKTPKQFHKINERPLISYSLEALTLSSLIQSIYIACNPDYLDKMHSLASSTGKPVFLTPGSKTRVLSILNALEEIRKNNVITKHDYVLITDAARPLISQASIEANIHWASIYGASMTVGPVPGTIMLVRDGFAVQAMSRSLTQVGQAPQAYQLETLYQLIDRSKNDNLSSYLHTREEFRRVLNHSRIMTMPPYRVAISKAFREASAFLRICRFQG
jgi:2-C-methyl-D-erythritol 4-phosphate cytidylyltransferase